MAVKAGSERELREDRIKSGGTPQDNSNHAKVKRSHLTPISPDRLLDPRTNSQKRASYIVFLDVQLMIASNLSSSQLQLQ